MESAQRANIPNILVLYSVQVTGWIVRLPAYLTSTLIVGAIVNSVELQFGLKNLVTGQ